MAGKQQVGNLVGLAGLVLVVLAVGVSCVAGHDDSQSTVSSNAAPTYEASAAATTTDPLSPKDRTFLKALDVGYIPYGDNMQAVLQAQAVCVFLSPANGGSYVDATQGVAEHNPHFTNYQTGFFIGAAVRILCPDEASTLPAG